MLTEADLVELLRKADGTPALFIGSGLSRRYLGLESWEDLLRRFADMASQGKVDLPYEFYRDRALRSKDGGDIPDLAYVAQVIEKDFNDTWHLSPNFTASRQLFRAEVRRGVSPLKLEIANYVRKKTFLNEPWVAAETDLLRQIGERNIAAIITTNYDTLVEDLFPSFSVFVGQEELLMNHSEGFAEIYKIHGSCSAPESLVVTRNDYKLFQAKNAYLSAKLMALFWEHPIIFLGYSLSDSNIQNILGSIANCLSDDNLNMLGKRLIFVEWNNSGEEDQVESHTKSFGTKTIPMTRVSLRDFITLYKAILTHKPIHQYPTALLRKLRNDIYQVVIDAEPSDFIIVNNAIDPSTPGDKLKDIKYVVGIGVQNIEEMGYTMIPDGLIYKDILFDDLTNRPDFDVGRFVSLTLPQIVKKNGGGPVFKYLSQVTQDQLDALDPRVKEEAMRRSTFDAFFSNSLRRHRSKYLRESIKSIRAKYTDLSKCCYYVCYLPEEQLDLEDLRILLTDSLTQYPDVLDSKDQADANFRTALRRLIRLYDWMVYGSLVHFPEQ